MKRYSTDLDKKDGEWVKFEDVKATMEKVLLIMEKGTPNRRAYRRYKVWEQKIIKLCNETIGISEDE